MTGAEKKVAKAALQAEKEILKELEREYREALAQIEANIKALNDSALRMILLGDPVERQNAQSKIYQQQYQKALREQINAALENLHAKEYGSIQEYLETCYQNGYAGSMYSFLEDSGATIVQPIDPNLLIKAIQTDSKLSEPLYETLGFDIQELKRKVRSIATRGVASGLSYNEIAQNLQESSRIALNRAKVIARTEGHRIQESASLDAARAAKAEGADVVKQWDSALDNSTRPSHRLLDGQIREMDEEFEVNGHKAECPGAFGVAAEDINCRCTILTRARWALDENELKILKERAAFFELDKGDSFEEFRRKYLKATAELNTDDFDYMSASFKPKFGSEIETREATYKTATGSKLLSVELKKVTNSNYRMYADLDMTRRNKAIRLAEKKLNEIQSELPSGFEMPEVAVIDFKKHGIIVDAIGAFDRASGTMFINSEYDTESKIESWLKKAPGMFASTNPNSPYLHELGHKMYEDSVKSIANASGIGYNKARDVLDNRILDFISAMNKSDEGFLEREISIYAQYGYEFHEYTEIIAESMTVFSSNDLASKILALLAGD